MFQSLRVIRIIVIRNMATYNSGSHSFTIGTFAPGTQKTLSMPCFRNTSASISTPCSPNHEVNIQMSTSLVFVPRSLTVELEIERRNRKGEIERRNRKGEIEKEKEGGTEKQVRLL